MELVDLPPTNSQETKPPKGSLWRFFNKEDELLYVSIKPNPALMCKNDWWGAVCRIEIEHFDSKDTLSDAKATAIYNELPKWNAQGRPTDVDG